jgi:hypothetical protein
MPPTDIVPNTEAAGGRLQAILSKAKDSTLRDLQQSLETLSTKVAKSGEGTLYVVRKFEMFARSSRSRGPESPGSGTSRGAVSVSLQDVSLFFLVLIVASSIAKGVRFFLDEELFPRTGLEANMLNPGTSRRNHQLKRERRERSTISLFSKSNRKLVLRSWSLRLNIILEESL